MRKTTAHISNRSRQYLSFVMLVLVASIVTACAQVDVPQQKPVSIPAPQSPPERKKAVNEKPDAVQYLPLGQDVLVPERETSRGLPEKKVGPYELRGETLAGALKLITSDQNIPIAFQTDEGLSTTVTVAELQGPMDKVIGTVCGVANLYCSFENGMLTVKETEVFTVTMPPIGGSSGDGGGDDLSGDTGELLDQVSTAIEEITGNSPVVDESTRTMIYRATQRTSDIARRYFQRLRAQTALIQYEMYIWQVNLNSANSTGIDFGELDAFSNNLNLTVPGSFSGDTVGGSNPIQLLLEQDNEEVLFEFLSTFGAVKTISQPRLAMLSGSSANLEVQREESFVSELSRDVGEGDEEDTISTTTDTVSDGFSLTIASNWDNSSVYSRLNLEFSRIQGFETFAEGTGNELSLPITADQNINTQVRMRPGDAMLIAGLIEERDDVTKRGPGASSIFFPTGRSAIGENSELVILLEPSVTVFTEEPKSDKDAKRSAGAGASSQVSSNTTHASGIRSRKIGRSQSHPRSSSGEEPDIPEPTGEYEQKIEYDVFNPAPQ